MVADAQGWTILQAQCFCEEDRPIVQRNVAGMMKDAGLVTADTQEQEALSAFDQLARN